MCASTREKKSPMETPVDLGQFERGRILVSVRVVYVDAGGDPFAIKLGGDTDTTRVRGGDGPRSRVGRPSARWSRRGRPSGGTASTG